MHLAGRTAIVTGGARGIGRAIAERYVREGARVAVADLNEAGAREVAGAVGGDSFGVQLDVTRQTSIDAMMRTLIERTGRVDILVNNAGLFDLAPTIEITRKSYARVFAVDVEGLLPAGGGEADDRAVRGIRASAARREEARGRRRGAVRPDGARTRSPA